MANGKSNKIIKVPMADELLKRIDATVAVIREA